METTGPAREGLTHAKTNTAAKVSLAAGVVSLFFLFPAVYYGSFFEARPDQIRQVALTYLLCAVPALEFGGIAGITAGIVALRQIQRTGERGTWAAVTGLVFGIISLAIVIFVYSSKFMEGWL